MNKEIKKYTEMFHYTYEMLALNFGYETRKDTKKFDFDTPNGQTHVCNGRKNNITNIRRK